MPTFRDILIERTLIHGRGKSSFSDFIDREIGYNWDGTPEGKILLMQMIQDQDRGGNIPDTKKEKDYIYSESNIRNLESQLLPILAKMEYRGIRISQEKLKNIGQRIYENIDRIEKEIYEVTGEFFNINSPKQVAQLLFEKFGIKPMKKNKTGYSVDNEVLEEIAKHYDIARLILEYRSLTKLYSTYVEGLLREVKNDGKIHTTFSQIGAVTGRMSSNDPNLQNIPTTVGYGSQIKSCFIPNSEENILLVADYSQIELRVLAWLSQDKALLEAFEKGEDIHMRTARFLFPYMDEIGGEERRVAKTVNFGVIYGITGFGLAKTLGFSPKEAQKYIEAFYDRYPGVHDYYKNILEQGKVLGYVETAFGRRRYIPGLNDSNKTLRSIAEREAINMPIQGTAADMLKYAMIDIEAKVRNNKLRGSMILQVHDELVFDIPEYEIDDWKIIIQDSMENVLIHHISEIIPYNNIIPPIQVDIHTGKNWFEAKT